MPDAEFPYAIKLTIETGEAESAIDKVGGLIDRIQEKAQGIDLGVLSEGVEGSASAVTGELGKVETAAEAVNKALGAVNRNAAAIAGSLGKLDFSTLNTAVETLAEGGKELGGIASVLENIGGALTAMSAAAPGASSVAKSLADIKTAAGPAGGSSQKAFEQIGGAADDAKGKVAALRDEIHRAINDADDLVDIGGREGGGGGVLGDYGRGVDWEPTQPIPPEIGYPTPPVDPTPGRVSPPPLFGYEGPSLPRGPTQRGPDITSRGGWAPWEEEARKPLHPSPRVPSLGPSTAPAEFAGLVDYPIPPFSREIGGAELGDYPPGISEFWSKIPGPLQQFLGGFYEIHPESTSMGAYSSPRRLIGSPRRGATPSTMAHETGHEALDMATRMASLPGEGQMAEDLGQLLQHGKSIMLGQVDESADVDMGYFLPYLQRQYTPKQRPKEMLANIFGARLTDTETMPEFGVGVEELAGIFPTDPIQRILNRIRGAGTTEVGELAAMVTDMEEPLDPWEVTKFAGAEAPPNVEDLLTSIPKPIKDFLTGFERGPEGPTSTWYFPQKRSIQVPSGREPTVEGLSAAVGKAALDMARRLSTEPYEQILEKDIRGLLDAAGEDPTALALGTALTGVHAAPWEEIDSIFSSMDVGDEGPLAGVLTRLRGLSETDVEAIESVDPYEWVQAWDYPGSLTTDKIEKIKASIEQARQPAPGPRIEGGPSDNVLDLMQAVFDADVVPPSYGDLPFASAFHPAHPDAEPWERTSLFPGTMDPWMSGNMLHAWRKMPEHLRSFIGGVKEDVYPEDPSVPYPGEPGGWYSWQDREIGVPRGGAEAPTMAHEGGHAIHDMLLRVSRLSPEFLKQATERSGGYGPRELRSHLGAITTGIRLDLDRAESSGGVDDILPEAPEATRASLNEYFDHLQARLDREGSSYINKTSELLADIFGTEVTGIGTQTPDLMRAAQEWLPMGTIRRMLGFLENLSPQDVEALKGITQDQGVWSYSPSPGAGAPDPDYWEDPPEADAFGGMGRTIWQTGTGGWQYGRGGRGGFSPAYQDPQQAARAMRQTQPVGGSGITESGGWHQFQLPGGGASTPYATHWQASEAYHTAYGTVQPPPGWTGGAGVPPVGPSGPGPVLTFPQPLRPPRQPFWQTPPPQPPAWPGTATATPPPWALGFSGVTHERYQEAWEQAGEELADIRRAYPGVQPAPGQPVPTIPPRVVSFAPERRGGPRDIEMIQGPADQAQRTQQLVASTGAMNDFGRSIMRTAGYFLRWLIVWNVFEFVMNGLRTMVTEALALEEITARVAFMQDTPREQAREYVLDQYGIGAAQGMMPAETRAALPGALAYGMDVGVGGQLRRTFGMDPTAGIQSLQEAIYQTGKSSDAVLNMAAGLYQIVPNQSNELLRIITESGIMARQTGLPVEDLAQATAMTGRVMGTSPLQVATAMQRFSMNIPEEMTEDAIGRLGRLTDREMIANLSALGIVTERGGRQAQVMVEMIRQLNIAMRDAGGSGAEFSELLGEIAATPIESLRDAGAELGAMLTLFASLADESLGLSEAVSGLFANIASELKRLREDIRADIEEGDLEGSDALGHAIAAWVTRGVENTLIAWGIPERAIWERTPPQRVEQGMPKPSGVMEGPPLAAGFEWEEGRAVFPDEPAGLPPWQATIAQQPADYMLGLQQYELGVNRLMAVIAEFGPKYLEYTETMISQLDDGQQAAARRALQTGWELGGGFITADDQPFQVTGQMQETLRFAQRTEPERLREPPFRTFKDITEAEFMRMLPRAQKWEEEAEAAFGREFPEVKMDMAFEDSFMSLDLSIEGLAKIMELLNDTMTGMWNIPAGQTPMIPFPGAGLDIVTGDGAGGGMADGQMTAYMTASGAEVAAMGTLTQALISLAGAIMGPGGGPPPGHPQYPGPATATVEEMPLGTIYSGFDLATVEETPLGTTYSGYPSEEGAYGPPPGHPQYRGPGGLSQEALQESVGLLQYYPSDRQGGALPSSRAALRLGAPEPGEEQPDVNAALLEYLQGDDYSRLSGRGISPQRITPGTRGWMGGPAPMVPTPHPPAVTPGTRGWMGGPASAAPASIEVNMTAYLRVDGRQIVTQVERIMIQDARVTMRSVS